MMQSTPHERAKHSARLKVYEDYRDSMVNAGIHGISYNCPECHAVLWKHVPETQDTIWDSFASCPHCHNQMLIACTHSQLSVQTLDLEQRGYHLYHHNGQHQYILYGDPRSAFITGANDE